MEYKHKPITNEALRKKFKNQFELVSYAINLAENMIMTGRDPRVRIDTQNRAMQVLAEIFEGKDFLDPIVEQVKQEEKYAAAAKAIEAEQAAVAAPKVQPEKKRARKILLDS